VELALVLNVIKMLYHVQVLLLLPHVPLVISYLQLTLVLLVQLELNHVHHLLLLQLAQLDTSNLELQLLVPLVVLEPLLAYQLLKL